MGKTFPEPTRAEWAVMKKIWDLKKSTVREVFEQIGEEQGWAYNTIRTMMDRLRDKGYLSVKKVGNTHVYQPAVSRRKVTGEAINRFVDRVLGGAAGPMFSYLIQDERLSDEEIEEIKALLRRRGEIK